MHVIIIEVVVVVFVVFFLLLILDVRQGTGFGKVKFDEMASIHLYIFIADFNNLVVCHNVVSLWCFSTIVAIV